jgi:hypothetical protein
MCSKDDARDLALVDGVPHLLEPISESFERFLRRCGVVGPGREVVQSSPVRVNICTIPGYHSAKELRMLGGLQVDLAGRQIPHAGAAPCACSCSSAVSGTENDPG